jgi:chromosome segregation ATPase
MTNAASTVDASKASQSPERRVLYYAISAAVIILAGAVAYRIATTEGDVDVAGGRDGLSVKITQAENAIESANDELKAAQQQLTEAQARLSEREAALARVEQELKAKEQRIEQLLQKLLEPSTRPPTPLALNAAKAELHRLKAERVEIAPASPASNSALKQRVSKIDDLQRSLARTKQSLKE